MLLNSYWKTICRYRRQRRVVCLSLFNNPMSLTWEYQKRSLQRTSSSFPERRNSGVHP